MNKSIERSKIAVTGARGRLGSELVRRGCAPLKVDVTDFQALDRAIKAISPEMIIHCAAFTDVDACQLSPIRAAKTNMGGTFGLSRVFNAKIIYISTDYIFDGRFGPYTEDDKPNPINIYGWSKLGGELIIKARRNSSDLIIRTTALFDGASTNFAMKIIEQLLAGRLVHLPEKLYSSPTYIPHVAQAILKAIEEDINGLLNLAGVRVISRYEFGRLIAGELNLDLRRIRSGPITGCAPRPHNAGLIVDKAVLLGIPIKDPLDAIREICR